MDREHRPDKLRDHNLARLTDLDAMNPQVLLSRAKILDAYMEQSPEAAAQRIEVALLARFRTLAKIDVGLSLAV